jgi:hypothetical protein
MVSASTIQRLQSAYKVWDEQKGSTTEPWFELMADLVYWRSIGGGEKPMNFTAPRLSKQQVRDYFNGLAQDWQMEFYQVHTFLVEGDKVAAIGECCWRHKHTGKVVHTPKLDLIRFQHDRISGFFEFFDTHQAVQAATMGPDAQIDCKPRHSTTDAVLLEGVSDTSKANLFLLERLYKNWNETKGRSVDEIMNVLAPQVSWGSLANGANAIAFTTQKTSKQDVVAYFQGLAGSFEMNFYSVDDFTAAADYVLMTGFCSFTNKATKKTFESPKADLWRFSNHQAVEFFEYYDTAAVLATTQ